MAELSFIGKLKAFLKYGFVKAYKEGKINMGLFLDNVDAIKGDLVAEGLTEFDIKNIAKLFVIRDLRAEKVQKEFSKNMIVYHASASGENFEIVNSFLNEGARSDIAKGYGQGGGFYVFTDREKAVKQAFDILNPDSDINKEVAAKGYPILVALDVNIKPVDWDLGYEVEGGFVSYFIYENFDLFKRIPDGAIEIDGKPLYTSKSTKNENINTFSLKIGNSSGGNAPGSSDISIWQAKVFGRIFDYIQKNFPERSIPAEIKIFKKPMLSTAIKYIGKKPLKVSKIEIFIDNKWIDVKELLKNKPIANDA